MDQEWVAGQEQDEIFFFFFWAVVKWKKFEKIPKVWDNTFDGLYSFTRSTKVDAVPFCPSEKWRWVQKPRNKKNRFRRCRGHIIHYTVGRDTREIQYERNRNLAT